jgi:hypothetical protein
MPVPALACAAGPACGGAKPREETQGPLIHPGERPGKGKAGRANVSEPSTMPRNGQLRRWDEDRGDRAWPLEERRATTGEIGPVGRAPLAPG